MKLYEITQPTTLTKDQINWLTAMKIKYTINPQGLIDVNGDVNISVKKLTSIPVQFGHVSGYFYCDNNNLTSLQGAPQSVSGYFACYGNKLTSLQHAPQSVGGNFNCDNNNLTSLHDIHKQIKYIKGKFVCDNKIKSHILGLLLIKDLKELDGIKEVEDIINKHLFAGDHDVHMCQEDLIQAGFPEMARL